MTFLCLCSWIAGKTDLSQNSLPNISSHMVSRMYPSCKKKPLKKCWNLRGKTWEVIGEPSVPHIQVDPSGFLVS